MPRQGPRPYDCVKRAWHSDRHQAMRGSLIQEIFRCVNEIHSSTTKKKKEWQEKLPIVVLKAEEIMYSKANSEAEYMDLKTVRNRARDAIKTMIRRDESSEIGELLQPCVEDASNKIPQADSANTPDNSPGIGCELLLQLSPVSAPCNACISSEKSLPREVEDVSSTSQDRSKSSGLTPSMDENFSFLNSNPNAVHCSEAENMKAETAKRKRKGIFSYPSEDRQFG